MLLFDRIKDKTLIVLHERKMNRKLSDILIEIAMQGLKNPKYKNSEVMHPLMFLSHIAWNRVTKSSDYLEDSYRGELLQFPTSKRKLCNELTSTDWDEILQKMIEYKQINFPNDRRVITFCGFTPQSTLRVEWR